jgi:hypothetical protein
MRPHQKSNAEINNAHVKVLANFPAQMAGDHLPQITVEDNASELLTGNFSPGISLRQSGIVGFFSAPFKKVNILKRFTFSDETAQGTSEPTQGAMHI